MSSLTAIRKQDYPDGEAGHNERQLIQAQSRRNKPKKKFTGLDEPKPIPPLLPWQNKELQRSFDIAQMKANCPDYKEGCQISQCNGICRTPLKRSRELLITKMNQNNKELKMKRHEYWNTTIAFPCPITERKHLVGDCFNNCEMWGRTYQQDEDGRAVAILYCYMDCHGERELHSGKITRDN